MTVVLLGKVSQSQYLDYRITLFVKNKQCLQIPVVVWNVMLIVLTKKVLDYYYSYFIYYYYYYDQYYYYYYLLLARLLSGY